MNRSPVGLSAKNISSLASHVMTSYIDKKANAISKTLNCQQQSTELMSSEKREKNQRISFLLMCDNPYLAYHIRCNKRPGHLQNLLD